MNRRSRRGVNIHTTPCSYWEDTGMKDQGQALLDEGSAPPKPDENGPAIMAVATPTASEDDGTHKTPSK
jgi:hypothetical protein